MLKMVFFIVFEIMNFIIYLNSLIIKYQPLSSFIIKIITIILTAWFAASWALGKYFQGQKTERLQRVYYEDAIIKPLNRIEELYSKINTYSAIFTGINNYIGAKLQAAAEIHSNNPTDSEYEIFKNIISIEYINKTISEIKNIDGHFSNNSLKEIFNKTAPDFGTYFCKWLNKIEGDMSFIIMILKNICQNYADYLSENQKYIKIHDLYIRRNTLKMNNYVAILNKHILLARLATDLKCLLATKKYKNKKTLIRNIKNDSTFLETANNFIEAYKRLFCYHQDPEDKNVFTSYAKNPSKKHYKLNFDEDKDMVKIEESELSLSKNLQELDSFQELAIANAAEFNGIQLNERLFELVSPILIKDKKRKFRGLVKKFFNLTNWKHPDNRLKL